MKNESSVIIDRPLEQVWKLIVDFANYPKWDPVIVELRKTSAGTLGLGTTLEVRRKDKRIIPERVIEYEPNRKFSFVITSGPVEGTIGTFSLENIEGKTRLTEAADLKFGGFYKLVGRFVAGNAKREAVARIRSAKRILEHETQS